jgi:hypothetical protein
MERVNYRRALNVAEKPSVARSVTDILYGANQAQRVIDINIG